MKQKILEVLDIPAGINCSYQSGMLKCSKDSNEVSRHIDLPGTILSLEENKISLSCKAGNKNDLKTIKSYAAHIRNLFSGLANKFVYSLEACNVHFPMTLKQEPGKLIITNFLGEKIPREAIILPNVDVVVKGVKITVSSHDREAAGQTAANLEKATKVKGRDRRIFQDGIFIVEKPGRRN